MAWTKVSTNTTSWISADTETDAVSANAYASDGSSVLQQFITFLATRGWTGSLTPAIVDSGTIISYSYFIQKTAVCEDGGSTTWGFEIRYLNYTTSTDTLRMYGWDPSNDVVGTTVYMNADVGTQYSFSGKWSYWVSDEDSDSFAVIPGEGGMTRCIGFWPHSGEMFSQGYYSTDFPRYSGLKPLCNTSLSFEGAAANGISDGATRLTGVSSGSTGMNPQPFKLDYMWMLNGYDRPIFRSFGGDIGTYLDPTMGGQSVFGPNQSTYVDSMLIDGKYYIAIGQYQKLLLEVGTVPPIF